jgi:hypothetical protein
VPNDFESTSASGPVLEESLPVAHHDRMYYEPVLVEKVASK